LSLKLDLYVPEKSDAKCALLVWIHGGGWTKGSKNGVNASMLRLTREGYAVASIDYRLTGLQSHPKQIHDCKGAIRWLQANADKYGCDVTRIGAGGGSAGGHLASDFSGTYRSSFSDKPSTLAYSTFRIALTPSGGFLPQPGRFVDSCRAFLSRSVAAL